MSAGLLEQRFELIDDNTIDELPGFVPGVRERGDPDPRLGAALSIHEITREVARYIHHYNRLRRVNNFPLDEEMVRADVRPYPAELYRWGIAHRTGDLRVVERDVLRLHLLPGDKATVTKRGIRWCGNYYTCSRADDEQWFQMAADRGQWDIDIAYRPSNVDQIYLRADGAATIEVCRIKQRRDVRHGRNYYELQQYDLNEATQTVLEGQKELAGRIDLIAERTKTVTAALDRSNTADAAAAAVGINVTKAGIVRDIEEHGRAERELEQRQTGWHLSPGPATNDHSPVQDTDAARVLSLGINAADQDEVPPLDRSALLRSAWKDARGIKE